MNEVMQQPKQFPTIKEMTEWAFEALAGLDFGESVSYAALSDVCRTNTQQTRGRSAVLRAGRRLLKERNRLLVNVKGYGYRVVSSHEHVTESQRFQRHARRRLTRALAVVIHFDPSRLTADQLAKTLTEQVRCSMKVGFDRKMSRVKTLPKRELLALPSGSKLVELFTKNGAP